MKVTCISDLHGFRPRLEGGQLLIVSGDLTARDHFFQHVQFIEWLQVQPYKHKIVVAGNHDGYLAKNYPEDSCIYKMNRNFIYLQDSECIIEGLKVYGMPWTSPFLDWHFMANEKEMKKRVLSIPHDVDILITHGPAHGILDHDEDRNLGCPILLNRLWELDCLKLHVFGHIHSGYGQKTFEYGQNGKKKWKLLSVNCALMTEDYRPDNEPIEIDYAQNRHFSVLGITQQV